MVKFMIKDIVYNKGLLSIYLEGKINKKNIYTLRKKMYYIIHEYGIKNILINLNNINYFDSETFYDFLDEFDDKIGGNLKLEKEEVYF